MKRFSLCGQHNIISQVHIGDGFYDDCDELISRCTKLESVDYQSFCSIWKEMNLGFLYQGRTSGPEIAELSEELVHVAKYYFLRDTSNFEESVAGLFLAYGLLTLQPYKDFAWMRIIPDDVPALRRMEVVARREKRHDVLYILGAVLINHCQYHVAERERGLERSYRKYIEGCRGIDKLGVRPKGVFYRQNEELDVIRELGALSRQYVRAKNCVVGSASTPSLNYIDEGLTDYLDTSLKKIINGMTGNIKDGEDTDDDSEPEHYESVQAIKQKAMTNAVNPMKHLTAVQDRKVEKVNKQQSELKSPKGKVKIASQNERIPGLTGTCTKRKKTPSPSANKKRKSEKPARATRTETVIVLDTSDDTELNLKEFSRVVADKSPVKKAKKPIPPENTEFVDMQTVNDLDIELNSLPVIITTGEPGESIEIEIFDEYKGDANKEEAKPSTSTNPSPNDKRKIVKKKGALSEKLKPPETSDLKRCVLKSKFKKMGILQAANFEESKSKD